MGTPPEFTRQTGVAPNLPKRLASPLSFLLKFCHVTAPGVFLFLRRNKMQMGDLGIRRSAWRLCKKRAKTNRPGLLRERRKLCVLLLKTDTVTVYCNGPLISLTKHVGMRALIRETIQTS